MENNTRTQALVKAYEMSWNLAAYYFSKLENIDLHKRYELEGVKMNSAYWILAHMVWTEHFLILEGIGGESIGIEWLNDFGFGADPDSIQNPPSVEEIKSKMDEVHKRALEILNTMTDEMMMADNNIEATFGGSQSKESVLMHAIRHAPMHVGQISWILKINGIKMV
jgi:uncharacterized damage-inducible protein DinB